MNKPTEPQQRGVQIFNYFRIGAATLILLLIISPYIINGKGNTTKQSQQPQATTAKQSQQPQAQPQAQTQPQQQATQEQPNNTKEDLFCESDCSGEQQQTQQTPDKTSEEVKKIKNAIQNILDDNWSDKRGIQNMPGYGNGEKDLVERFKNNRAEAKQSEIDRLIEFYGKEIKINGEKVKTYNKPTAVFVLSSTCPSCQKNALRFVQEVVDKVCPLKDNLQTNSNTKPKQKTQNKKRTKYELNYQFYIREAKKEKDKGKELDNLKLSNCMYDVYYYKQDDTNKLTNRVPAVLFFTPDGKLFDIGGNVSPDRIEEILNDIPNF